MSNNYLYTKICEEYDSAISAAVLDVGSISADGIHVSGLAKHNYGPIFDAFSLGVNLGTIIRVGYDDIKN